MEKWRTSINYVHPSISVLKNPKPDNVRGGFGTGIIFNPANCDIKKLTLISMMWINKPVIASRIKYSHPSVEADAKSEMLTERVPGFFFFFFLVYFVFAGLVFSAD